MKTVFTRQQVRQYREDGFLIVPDFLSEPELAQWHKTLAEVLETRRTQRLPGQTSEAEESSAFVQRLNLWQSSTKMRALILSEEIGRLCCELEGVAGIRVWHDQALIKRPWDDATTWHRDVPYFSFDSQHCITIWIALDDVTMQNGCLYFLPGTHRRMDYQPAGFGPKMREMFDLFPEWETLAPVPAIMKAGSCSFHNGLTAHAAGPNMTTAQRRAMTCAFMPDGSTFNGKKNILPDSYYRSLKVGDRLENDDWNPVIARAVRHKE